MGDIQGRTVVNGSNGGNHWRVDRPRPSWNRSLTQIKAVGVGDGGCTSVRRMSGYDVPGVQYIMVNTSTGLLERPLNVTEVVQVGQRVHSAWDASRRSQATELAVEETDIQLRGLLEDAELVLITAGMGGGTGTKAARHVGALARDVGAFVLGVVTTPFSFEGSRRIGEAMAGVAQLRPCVDNLIVLHSDRLLRFINYDAGISEAFSKVDEVVSQGLLSISELLNDPWEVKVDFAEVRNVLRYSGGALMAVGRGRGRMGAVEAAQQAITYPLLNLSIAGARGILFSVRGGHDLTQGKVDAAGAFIERSVRNKPRILFGTTVDPRLDDEVHLTLIATGL